MVKIKMNLFESIVCAIILPNVGFILTTILLIISLIIKQDLIVYKGIIISYIICFLLIIVSVIICFLVNEKSKKEFILCNGEITVFNHTYAITQISSCEYYVCKWYALPIVFIYKQQVGGLIVFRFNNGKVIQFKILYKDYLKIKNEIHNIVLK